MKKTKLMKTVVKSVYVIGNVTSSAMQHDFSFRCRDIFLACQLQKPLMKNFMSLTRIQHYSFITNVLGSTVVVFSLS